MYLCVSVNARVKLDSRSNAFRRLWYVTASARKTAGADEQQNSVPVEIGYMNVIPKCLDSSGKYPIYENLPETYAAINSYLAENPLEGITQFPLNTHFQFLFSFILLKMMTTMSII